jgi:hypothetical protein
MTRIINKGRGDQPKDERNERLIADYELVRKGELKMSNLIGKYNISSTRIGQILDKHGVKRIR